jgi:hypothetical protein
MPGPVIDSRFEHCRFAERSASNARSCRHPARGLLFPAEGCSLCPVSKRPAEPHLRRRNKRHYKGAFNHEMDV